MRTSCPASTTLTRDNLPNDVRVSRHITKQLLSRLASLCRHNLIHSRIELLPSAHPETIIHHERACCLQRILWSTRWRSLPHPTSKEATNALWIMPATTMIITAPTTRFACLRVACTLDSCFRRSSTPKLIQPPTTNDPTTSPPNTGGMVFAIASPLDAATLSVVSLAGAPGVLGVLWAKCSRA